MAATIKEVREQALARQRARLAKLAEDGLKKIQIIVPVQDEQEIRDLAALRTRERRREHQQP